MSDTDKKQRSFHKTCACGGEWDTPDEHAQYCPKCTTLTSEERTAMAGQMRSPFVNPLSTPVTNPISSPMKHG